MTSKRTRPLPASWPSEGGCRDPRGRVQRRLGIVKEPQRSVGSARGELGITALSPPGPPSLKDPIKGWVHGFRGGDRLVYRVWGSGFGGCVCKAFRSVLEGSVTGIALMFLLRVGLEISRVI